MLLSLALIAAVVKASAAAQNVPSTATHNSSSDYVADLGYVKYQGALNGTVVNYFGIRYAEPPLGELRWQAPMDIESHGGYDASTVLDATVQGPVCLQWTPYWRNTTLLVEPGESEDCLLLDILVPAEPVSDYIPVLVQIHGGGYDEGNAESSPGYLMVDQAEGALLYVTIQYRLGAMGFLSSTEIRDNGAANAGLLDQRAALNWVQRNVRAFGGDPSKVTIIGGSAGGGSVMDQMIIYGGVSNPPFRAVISEYPSWHSYKNDTILETQYREMLAGTGCSNLVCLRSQTTESLINAMEYSLTVGYTNGVYGYGDFYYGPSVDGDVIRDLPSNEFKRGHFTKVPLLTNRDGYEGYNYSPKNETTQAQETMDLQTIFPYAKRSFFTRLYELYPASEFNSTLFQRQQIYGDYIISCPTYYMATATSDHGLATWKMIFDAGTELHGADIPFLWGFGQSAANNLTLSSIMIDWYLGFALHLDPNSVNNSGTLKPFWPQYQAAMPSNSSLEQFGFTAMDVEYTTLSAVADRDAGARCDFFHGQSYVVRN